MFRFNARMTKSSALYTENRYVPIPSSEKPANCSYIERWDEKLNHIRYAREKSAPLCYGMLDVSAGKESRRHYDAQKC